MKPPTETDRHRGPRRTGQRSLGAAEGVLVALRHCSLDEAFTEIVQTAQRHGVAPLELADALVAVAEGDLPPDLAEAVITTVDQTWGTLLGRRPPSGATGRQTEGLQDQHHRNQDP